MKRSEWVDLEALTRRANRPEFFMACLSGLHWRRVGRMYRCRESDGLRIFRGADGQWCVKNHSDKLPVPSGNVWTFARAYFGLAGKDQFRDLCAQIARYAGVDLSNILQDRPEGPGVPIPQVMWERPFFEPNAGQALKLSYQWVEADTGSPAWWAVYAYWKRWGVSPRTLDRYGVRPLQWVRHLGSNRVTHFGEADFAMAYCIDGDRSTVKAKRPTRQQYKEFYLQNRGNYVFGYAQLPARCAYIVICAGEKDTLVLNQYGNAAGIYGICLASETARLEEAFVAQLRQRATKGVYLCYDNDETGRKYARRYGRELGIPQIDLGRYTRLKDQADVVEQEGSEALLRIIQRELQWKQARAVRPSDPLSLGVAQVIRLRIVQYLGEEQPNPVTGVVPLKELRQLILQEDRLVLQAPTGAGKTSGILQLVLSEGFRLETGLGQTLFCVPTVPLAEQLCEIVWQRYQLRVPCIKEGADEVDIREAEASRLVICTYNSLPKVGVGIQEALLVVDEFHELRNAKSYRDTACRDVLEHMHLARKVLAVSATPLYAFCIGLVPELDYQLVEVQPRRRQRITIQPRYYQGGSESDLFTAHTFSATGVHLVKKDHGQMLDAFAEEAEQRYGVRAAVLTSERRDDSPVYQSLRDRGEVPADVGYLFTTCLLDTGVSIHTQVGEIVLVNPRCPQSIAQFIARPRIDRDRGINEHIPCYTYHRAPHAGEEQYRRPVNPDRRAGLEVLIGYAKRLLEMVDYLHGMGGGTTLSQYKQLDDFRYIYYSELAGRWEIDYLQLLYDEYESRLQAMDPSAMYQHLAAEYPHITVMPAETITLQREASVREHLQVSREAQRQLAQVGRELLGDPQWQRASMELAYRHSRDPKFRKQIREALVQISRQPSAAARELGAAYPTLGPSGVLVEPIKRHLLHERLGVGVEQRQALQEVSGQQHRKWQNSLVALTELAIGKQYPELLSGKELGRVAHSRKLLRAVSKLRKAERQLTAGQLRALVGKVVGETVSFAQARLRVEELFEVVPVRCGKHTVYAIGQRRELAAELGISRQKIAGYLEGWKARRQGVSGKLGGR